MTTPTTPRTATRIVFLAEDDFMSPPAPFRTGAAGVVRFAEDDSLEMDERVKLSANAVHALIGHGVLDRLNELDLEGAVGRGVPVLIRPGLIEDARTILYAADPTTYGQEWEFLVDRDEGPPPVEFRVRVVNREYQIALVRLIDVFNRASRHGDAAWITI